MLLRGLGYIGLGWLLIAAVSGLGHVFALTVMLPSTTAVLVTHLAFNEDDNLPFGLAIALALGYLEDLHQGAPLGTLTLAYGLAYLGLSWTSKRLALPGILSRATASMCAVAAVDVLTWGILMVLAGSLGVSRDALNTSLFDARWHALATFLVAHPTWMAIDALFDAAAWIFRVLRLGRPPPKDAYPMKGTRAQARERRLANLERLVRR